MSSAATTVAIALVLSIWVCSTSDVVESAHHGGGAAAPAPAVDCSTVIVSMVDCLSYVSAGSVVKQPEGQCCSTLKTVLKTNAECLCEAFKNSAQLGVSLNITKALALPTACHLHAPSVSNCGLSLGGAPAPAISPSAMSPGSFVMAPNAGIAPGPVQGSSSGSSTLIASALTLVFGLLVAASATTTSLF